MDSLPAKRIKGTMIKEGSDSNICNCRSLAPLKMVSRDPSIGEMAKPGKEVTMDMETLKVLSVVILVIRQAIMKTPVVLSPAK